MVDVRRKIVGVVLILILAALLQTFYHLVSTQLLYPFNTTLKLEPSTVHHVTYHQFNQQGQKTVSLSALKMFPDADKTRLEQPILLINNDHQRWQITAQTATIQDHQQKVTFEHQVKVIDLGRNGKPMTTLTTEKLVYLTKLNQISSLKPVLIKKEGLALRSNRLFIDLNQKMVRLSKVDAQYDNPMAS